MSVSYLFFGFLIVIQDQRKREKDEQMLLDERREELSRLNAEYESLKKAKQEQDLLVDRLTSSRAEGS